MTEPDVTSLYELQIKPLPRALRLRLLAQIAQDLAGDEQASGDEGLDLLDLEGLGAEIWQGVDAQHYVDELRDEWDRQ